MRERGGYQSGPKPETGTPPKPRLFTRGDLTLRMEAMSTRPVNVNLLRSIECPHNPEWHRQVSDTVIYVGTSNTERGPIDYEIARQVIICNACGWVVEVRDVDRDKAF